MITAQQVSDTLALLIPGFVLLKVFYIGGLQTKRSDAQWTLWSILASAPIAGATALLDPKGGFGDKLAISLVLAFIGGALLSAIWRWLVKAWPNLGAKERIRAWDVVLSADSQWVQVELTDGRVFVGQPAFVASSVDTDDLDLYLRDVRQEEGRALTPIQGIEGILLPRSQVKLVAVFE